MKKYQIGGLLFTFLLFAFTVSLTAEISHNVSQSFDESGGEFKKEFVFEHAMKPDFLSIDKNLVPRHYLGENVALLNYLVRQTYVTNRSDVSSSTLGRNVEKPAIFASIQRMNRQLRKAVRKGVYSKKEAAEIFSDCLEKAYSLYYVETEGLEAVMREIETLEQCVSLYDRILFK